MHMFCREKNFYGGHGIVGAQVPLGTGLAFANRYRGNDNVCADLFRRRRRQPGPGLRELQHGRAVEAAGRLRHREQPVRHGHLGRARLGARPTSPSAARRFDIPGEQVDGMDVRAVKAAGDKARRAWCRAGKGPIILEMLTYRYRGHSMSDPAKYRTARGGRRRCAASTIRSSRCAQRLIEKQWASEDELKAIDARGARRSSTRPPNSPPDDPEPDPSELWTDVYA